MNTHKRVLYVIPDYGKPTLRVLANLLQLGFDVDVVAPYNILLLKRLLPIFTFNKVLFDKISRRIGDWDKRYSKVRIISTSIVNLTYRVVSDVLFKKHFFLYNSFKWVIELDIIKKIKWENYGITYCFDTCALPYIIESKKNGLKVILESRGSHIDHTLQLKEMLSVVEDIKQMIELDYRLKPNLVWWYNKIRTEPVYADFIYVYSNYQKKQYLDRGFDEEKLLKIPIASSYNKSCSIKTFNENKLTFLFVGAITIMKGVPNLLKAWHAINNKFDESFKIELRLVGAVREDMNLDNLPSNLIHLGHLNRQELEEEFRNADIFVFPTINDSFGQVVQEALSFNLPVITTAHCGAADFIEDGLNGYVVKDPFSILELEEKMMQFIQHPNLVNEMSVTISNTPVYDKFAEIESLNRQLKKVNLLP